MGLSASQLAVLTRAWERDKVGDLGIDGKEIEVKAEGSRCDHLRRVHGDKKNKKKNRGRCCQST